MKKSLLFVLLIAVLLIFAGCSKKTDCSTLDTSYERYTYDEDSKECILSQSVPKNVCGNGVAENDENFCSCPKDVSKTHPTLGCTGTEGDYLEKTCSEDNECVLSQNDKVVDQTKKVQFKNADVTFDGLFTIKTPFILNTYDDNKIEVDLSLFKTSSSANIIDLEVVEISIENTKSIVLATVDYNEPIQTVGSSLSEKAFGLGDTSKYSTKENLRAKLTVSYTKESLNTQGEVTKTEQKIETLTGSLGSWEIINPNFS